MEEQREDQRQKVLGANQVLCFLDQVRLGLWALQNMFIAFFWKKNPHFQILRFHLVSFELLSENKSAAAGHARQLSVYT